MDHMYHMDHIPIIKIIEFCSRWYIGIKSATWWLTTEPIPANSFAECRMTGCAEIIGVVKVCKNAISQWWQLSCIFQCLRWFQPRPVNGPHPCSDLTPIHSTFFLLPYYLLLITYHFFPYLRLVLHAIIHSDTLTLLNSCHLTRNRRDPKVLCQMVLPGRRRPHSHSIISHPLSLLTVQYSQICTWTHWRCVSCSQLYSGSWNELHEHCIDAGELGTECVLHGPAPGHDANQIPERSLALSFDQHCELWYHPLFCHAEPWASATPSAPADVALNRLSTFLGHNRAQEKE
jgi:hypothetical protein